MEQPRGTNEACPIMQKRNRCLLSLIQDGSNSHGWSLVFLHCEVPLGYVIGYW